jgi:hypothetical protein
MTMLPHARRLMTASLIAFLGAAVLTLTGTIDRHVQHLVQAGSLVSFGLAFGTTAWLMRTWLWRQSLAIAVCQALVGVGYLLWLSGAFR